MSTAGASQSLEQLGRLLDRAIRALGEAGEPDAACRLAAEGWWLTRDPAPRAARRLNATLHYLTVHPRNSDEKEEAMSTDAESTLDVRSEPPARRHRIGRPA